MAKILLIWRSDLDLLQGLMKSEKLFHQRTQIFMTILLHLLINLWRRHHHFLQFWRSHYQLHQFWRSHYQLHQSNIKYPLKFRMFHRLHHSRPFQHLLLHIYLLILLSHYVEVPEIIKGCAPVLITSMKFS